MQPREPWTQYYTCHASPNRASMGEEESEREKSQHTRKNHFQEINWQSFPSSRSLFPRLTMTVAVTRAPVIVCVLLVLLVILLFFRLLWVSWAPNVDPRNFSTPMVGSRTSLKTEDGRPGLPHTQTHMETRYSGTRNRSQSFWCTEREQQLFSVDLSYLWTIWNSCFMFIFCHWIFVN